MISPIRMPSCFRSFANLLSLRGGGINGDIKSGFRIAQSPLTNRLGFRLSNRLGRYGMLRRRWWRNTFRSWRDRLLERHDSIASDWVPNLCHEELLRAPKIEAGTRHHLQSSRSRWSPKSCRKHRVAKKRGPAPLVLGLKFAAGRGSYRHGSTCAMPVSRQGKFSKDRAFQ